MAFSGTTSSEGLAFGAETVESGPPNQRLITFPKGIREVWDAVDDTESFDKDRIGDGFVPTRS